MSRLALAFALSLATGCSLASVEKVNRPGQDPSYRIECDYSIDNCRRKAEDVCDGPYQVISDGDASCADCGMSISDSTGGEPGPPQAAQPSPVYGGVLLVRCGGADTPL